MDGPPDTAPPRGRHPMLDEALDLVDAARADGVDVRLVGGLAVLALCAEPRSCRRHHRDLDLVAPRPAAKRLLATFARLGYEENSHVRFASGGAVLQVYRPCAHLGSAGPAHADDRVDVYLDAFRQHHTIPLRRRLGREPYTVPPSDVLLAKLLRTHVSETDVQDVATLLRDVEVRDDEAAGTIGRSYLARACARDWGLYHDVTGNLARVAAVADVLGLGDRGAERVRAAAGGIRAALAAARKGPRWRLRARIGERLPWYDPVDENDGQRIGLRERPSRTAGAAAPGRGA
jgi:hypothetical protein